MFRLERFADGVFTGEPFAEVNELAPVRTKRPVFGREPVAGLFTRRAFDQRISTVGWRRQFSEGGSRRGRRQNAVLGCQGNVIFQDALGFIQHRIHR